MAQGENESVELAATLNHLGNLYRELGHYSQAEQPYLQALKIRGALLGRTHPEFATSLNDLANLYEAVGNYTQADQLYQRALAMRRQELGGEHTDCAQTL